MKAFLSNSLLNRTTLKLVDLSSLSAFKQKSMNMPSILTSVLPILLLFLSFKTTTVAQSSCVCAVRWTQGSSWNSDGTIDDKPSSKTKIKGVVACGNSAETEFFTSATKNCTYAGHVDGIEDLPSSCLNPDWAPPSVGCKVAWVNYDVRAGGSGYEFQVVKKGGAHKMLYYALYYSTTRTNSVGSNGLSGDCSSLKFLKCGIDGNGTYRLEDSVLSTVFTQNANLYLMVWGTDCNADVEFNFKARKGCGNVCNPPNVTCPADVSVQCYESIAPSATGTATYTDGCGNVTLKYDDQEITTGLSCPVLKQIKRTWTATDANGGTGTCVQTITVQDTEAPFIIEGSAEPSKYFENLCESAATPPSVESIAAIYTDKCSSQITATLTNTVADANNTSCNWKITYTFTVTDACGNTTTKDVIYTGSDSEAPQLTGTLPGGDLGNVCVSSAPKAPSVEDIAKLYTDNCSEIFVKLDEELSGIEGGNCNDGWTATYTYHVTDACGNNTDATVIYTGKDTEAPTLTGTAYAGTTGTDACKSAATTAAPFDATKAIEGYTDNCSSSVTATLTNTEVSGTDCAWSVKYTFDISDDCGNKISGSYSNSGSDQTAPVLSGTAFAGTSGLTTCKPSQSAAEAAFSPSDAIKGYTDGCSSTVTAKLTNALVEGSDCSWKVTYSFEVSDECGNKIAGSYANSGAIQAVDIVMSEQVNCIGDIPCPDATNPIIIALTNKILGSYPVQCGGTKTVTFVSAGDLVSCTNGKFGRDFKFTFKNDCFSATVTYKYWGNCQAYVTYTQGYWANKTVASRLTLIKNLLENGNRPIVLGRTDLTRSLKIEKAECVVALLPGGGTGTALGAGNDVLSLTSTSCKPAFNAVDKNGKLLNNLANNTIALQLNIWYNERYTSLNLNSFDLSLGCIGIPSDVMAILSDVSKPYLDNGKPTIKSLLKLINDYLGKDPSVPTTLGGSLTLAASSVNEYWDQGVIKYTCKFPSTSKPSTSTLNDISSALEITDRQFSVFPNPARNAVDVDLEQFKGVNADVLMYNATGKIVYRQKLVDIKQSYHTINLEGLTNGLYLVVLKTEEKQQPKSVKLLINK